MVRSWGIVVRLDTQAGQQVWWWHLGPGWWNLDDLQRGVTGVLHVIVDSGGGSFVGRHDE